MGLGKTYSTQYLADSNNNTGAVGQVLISTSTGVNWSDGSAIIGGPYLPLSAGSGQGLTSQLWFTGTTDANRKIFFTNAGAYAKGSMDAASYGFQVSGSEKLTILPSGNVGIGTTTPTQAKLVLDGSMAFNQGGESMGLVTPIFEGLEFRVADGVSTGDSVGMILKAAPVGGANVGIGTTVPNEKLDVRGKVYIESQGVDWNETTPGLTRGALHFDPVGSGADNTGNAITFGASDSSVGTNANSGIYTRSDGTYGTKMYFATTDSYTSGSKTRMMIDYNGNVGIGTTSPSAKLDVEGDDAKIRINNTTGTIADLTILDLTGLVLGSGAGNERSILLGQGGNASRQAKISYRQGSSNGQLPSLSFFTGDSVDSLDERMRIDSAGNVGIGTTSPGSKLSINSPTVENVPSLGVNSEDFNITYNNSFGLIGGVLSNGRSYLQSQRIDGTATAYNMLLQPNGGNVGIGVTNPSAKLHVDGTVRFSSSGDRIFIADGAFGTFELGDIDGAGSEGKIVGDGSNIIINNGGTETLRCSANNRVGIGVTSPSSKLDIKGTQSTTIPTINIVHPFEAEFRFSTFTGSNTSGQITYKQGLYYGTSGENATIAYYRGSSTTGGFMTFQTNNGTERMRIASSGNVGIGTNNPASYKLDVNGTGRFSGDLFLIDTGSTLSPEIKMQNNTHILGIDYQNDETLRFITRSGATTVPITFQMRAGTITAVNFILSSDERKKTNIQELSPDKVNVKWKSFGMIGNEGEYRTGAIAQELEQTHPEFVRTDKDGFKSVAYIDLLIAKIAELEARLEKAGI